MPFRVDKNLLAAARGALAGCRPVYWVIGGASAGKTTVCGILAERRGVAVYDMDARIYGDYMPLYSEERHPASRAYFSAPNPLQWVLSLTGEAFDALNRATTAEYLDLFAADPVLRDSGPLLVDGGVTHPSVLAQVIPPQNIVCLAATDADRVRAWETAPERAEMKQWIMALPDPDAMWRKFLAFDKIIADTMERECREAGIGVIVRNGETTAEATAEVVARRFNW